MESRDELCRSAMTVLVELLNLHDTYFDANKDKKMQLMQTKVTAIEALIQQIPEDAIDATCNAKIAYILGKAKNCFDHYSTEAEMYLRRAVKLSIRDPEAWNALAECLWKKADYSEVRECLVTSVAASPSIEAHCLLSMLEKLLVHSLAAAHPEWTKIQVYQCMAAESVRQAKAAVALDVSDSQAWYVLGNSWCTSFFSVSLELQDLQRAMGCYNKALDLLEFPSTAATDAGAVFATGTTAVRAERITRNKRPNPDLYYNRAVLCMYIQDFAGAVECYRIVQKQDPSLNPQLPGIIGYIEDYVKHLQHLTSGGFVLKPKKKNEFISQIEGSVAQYRKNPSGYKSSETPTDTLLADLQPGKNSGCRVTLKLLAAVKFSGSRACAEDNPYVHDHPEATYLVLDRHGTFGLVSVFHIGSDTSLCDHHASSNVVLTVADPMVRSQRSGPQAMGSLPADDLTIVQVFDISTCLANNKIVAAKKIAANRLNTRTFDS